LLSMRAIPSQTQSAGGLRQCGHSGSGSGADASPPAADCCVIVAVYARTPAATIAKACATSDTREGRRDYTVRRPQETAANREDDMIGRRTLIKRAAMVATAAATAGFSAPESNAQQAPNSTGSEPAKLKAPPNACDCHMHIYDPRFPETNRRPGPNPEHATVSDYRLLQKRTGTTRVVVVTPRNYATDNRVTVDALSQLGQSARGIAVLHPTVTDAELKSLNDAGIRGIRFTLGDPDRKSVV
jgi:hypothetical protein